MTSSESLECFVQIVACILYLGYEWIAETARKCSFSLLYLDKLINNATVLRDDLNLHRMMKSTWEDEQPSWKAASTLLRFANWLMVWCQNTPAAGRREAWTPHLFALGENTILTFAKPYNGGPYSFFPACLAKDEYTRLARA
ncbi:hypothetical protein BDZ45DRAFT_366277 [Acephala macrosclerotiorum]|nr:hypothetical protein BDZ45DRAFT_366277 [Acephala macrosclerotiorum]